MIADFMFGPDHPYVFSSVDASLDMTDMAELGMYPQHLLLETMAGPFGKYFNYAARSNFLEPNEEIRRKVEILPTTKVEDIEKSKKYDAVIAMNVIIHLISQGNAQIAANFIKCLSGISKGTVVIQPPKKDSKLSDLMSLKDLQTTGLKSFVDEAWTRKDILSRPDETVYQQEHCGLIFDHHPP